MDSHEIFLSCRVGDLEKVRYLVEARDVELNIRDKWDTTPLYYACLCGHETVVKYLLENGARCEANTFDGERCLYAALNDVIKKMLKEFKMITSKTMRRDPYDEFLRRLMNDEMHTDVVFKVKKQIFRAHRCVLAARCPQSHEQLRQRLDANRTIKIKNPSVDPEALQMILTYIYTGQMQCPYDQLQVVALLAKHFGLTILLAQLEKKIRQKNSFESTKPGVHIDVISIESNDDKQKLKADFLRLADQSLPLNLYSSFVDEMPFMPAALSIYPDMCVIVQGYRFMSHKAFFTERSDYFRALLEDHFQETSFQHTGVVHLNDITVEIFIAVLYYLYTDSCELTKENVFDLLYKSDLYLLPGLKTNCASFLYQMIDTGNIFLTLHLSRLYNLSKLESQCTEFIAGNIEELITREELAQFVVQDAASIKNRQETDSIDIIDNIRYHLTCHVQTFSELEEANKKLLLIDELLERLGLEC